MFSSNSDVSYDTDPVVSLDPLEKLNQHTLNVTDIEKHKNRYSKNCRKFKKVQKAFKQVIPPSTAVTYSPEQIPYHHPPIFYKLAFDSDEAPCATLYEREVTWNAIDAEYETEKEKNENFLRWYQENNCYPPTKWLAYQSSEHEMERNETETDETTQTDDHETNVVDKNKKAIVNVTNEQIGDGVEQKTTVEVTNEETFDTTTNTVDNVTHVEMGTSVLEEKPVDEEISLEEEEHIQVEPSTNFTQRITRKIRPGLHKSKQISDIRLMFDAEQTISGQNKILRRNKNYVWVIDTDCNFLFSPDKQDNFSSNRNSVKHGDLMATGNYLLGTVENMSAGRGPARMGGEFKWDSKRNTWTIDNDSSYCFFRDDNNIITNTNHIKWQNYVNKLLRSFGIETDDIVWLDLVKSRKLDSFVVQKISLAYKKYARGVDSETVIKKQANERTKLINLFRGVNLLSIVFGAFGAQSYFMTEGLLHFKVIEAINLPTPDVLKLMHSNPYVELSIRGCEKTMDQLWWKKPQRTSILTKTQSPVWNDTLQIYVTNHEVEIVDIAIYHKQLDPLQPLLLAKGSLELDDIDLNSLILPEIDDQQQESEPKEIWIELEPAVSNLSLSAEEKAPTNGTVIKQPKRQQSLLKSQYAKLKVALHFVPHSSRLDKSSVVREYSMLKRTQSKARSKRANSDENDDSSSDEDDLDELEAVA